MSKKVILCIDDEEIVLESLEDELSGQIKNTVVETCRDGAQALEMIETVQAKGGEVAVVICDYLMPGTMGDQVLVNIHTRFPSIINIMLTGQSQIDGVTRSINEANLFRFIAKPWDKNDLRLTLKSAMGQFEADFKLAEQERMIGELNKKIETVGNSEKSGDQGNMAEGDYSNDEVIDQIYFRQFYRGLKSEEKRWVADALIGLLVSDHLLSKKELDYVKTVVSEDPRQNLVTGYIEQLKMMVSPELTPLRVDKDRAYEIIKHLLAVQVAKRGFKDEERKYFFKLARRLSLDEAAMADLINITIERIRCNMREHKVAGRIFGDR